MADIDYAALAIPFDPKDVSFRIQTTPKEGKTSALVVAYVDARVVADRLDKVCGHEGWSFDWQPILTGTLNGKPAVLAAKGILTIAGVSKADVGDAGDTEPTKASVSDSLKRAAVLWGIGRYLYELPNMWGETVKRGNSTYLVDGEEDRLRAKYLSGKVAPRTTTTTAITNATTTKTATTSAPATTAKTNANANEPMASEQQMTSIRKLCVATNRAEPDHELTYAEARTVIAELSGIYQKTRRHA